MKVYLPIVLALVALGLMPLHAGDSLSAVELVRERGPREDRLIAINRTIIPVSAGVDLSALENATLLDASDVERTVPPNSELLLARVVRTEAGADWSYRHRFRWYPGAMETEHDSSHVYTLPYAEGQAYRVLQGFNGEFSHADRFAIDWAMPIGTRITAARGGIVLLAVDEHPEGGEDPAYLALANRIWILHDDGTIGVYAHIVQRSAQVALGERVETGHRLALSGNSGYSSRPHLHFEVRAGAADGRPRTFPIVFRTVRSEIAVPVADVSYMRPMESGTNPRIPTNVIGDLELSRRDADGRREPSDGTFDVNDRLLIRIGIDAPGRYSLRAEFYRENSQRRRLVRTLNTRHDQELAQIELELGALRDPRGDWLVRLMFEEQVLAERRFVVRARS